MGIANLETATSVIDAVRCYFSTSVYSIWGERIALEHTSIAQCEAESYGLTMPFIHSYASAKHGVCMRPKLQYL